MPNYGRFTARGGSEVEASLTTLLERMASAFDDMLAKYSYRSIVLLGGYGRGEGGVQIVEGEERPHNNLDLMVITTPAFVSASYDKLQARVAEFAKEADLGIDISFIEERKLTQSPCLVMWYDMRFGHKTVLGDAEFLGGLDRFSQDKIEPIDVLRLMVNRGTLLVINDVVLEKEILTASDRKLIIKHVMKALIGFGDAYLFSRGEYDWSYLEKQRRMQALTDAPDDLKQLYEEALEFRFSPNYEKYEQRDLQAWAEELRELLGRLYLDFERFRLGDEDLAWSGYLERALSHEFRKNLTSLRGLAKNVVFGLRSRGIPKALGLRGRLLSRCVGESVLMPVLYPSVSFDIEDTSFRQATQSFLGASSDDHRTLRHAYLRKWGETGDSNFQNVIEAQGISLEGSNTTA